MLAAQRRTSAQLAALDQILTRQACTTEPVELARINAEFHLAMAECAQNTLLTGYLRDLTKRVRFYFLPVAASRRGDSLAEHRHILDAIRRRDPSLAEKLVLAHVADTRRTVDALTGPTRPGARLDVVGVLAQERDRLDL